jgi:geranylgeranyl diphosphate synthase type I
MLETASGQMMDVMLPTIKGDQTEEDALLIFRFKTARYTISGPLQLGAILAGTDEDTLGKIQEFGDNLGIAFQIQDDILGVFGEEDVIGKSNTSDIEEGKITLLFLHALQNSSEEQKKVLSDNYGKGHINAEQLSQIRQIMIETGSHDYSKKLAAEYIQKSIALIPEVTADPKYQNILTEMSEFLVKRDK